jgi:hypothetical protein
MSVYYVSLELPLGEIQATIDILKETDNYRYKSINASHTHVMIDTKKPLKLDDAEALNLKPNPV